MTRIEVLNAIIQKKNVKNYLEIGVNRGKCLFNIKGPENRFAVDPFFNFNLWKKVKACVKNSDNYKNQYFEVTSDDFFKQNQDLLNNNKLQLTFIDGLHTYEQSLHDTLNTLKYSDSDGIIVLHDCNPLDALAAYPAESIDVARAELKDHKDWKNIWNGDVWKAIVHIRKNHPELTAFVLDTDHGLGFVYKKNRAELPEVFKSISSINDLNYEFLDKNRNELLDLKPVSYFEAFLKTI
jgi:Methyltransferase domain